RMMRVHSTCARGARAIAVPWWPDLAACGASIASPRITSIARRSRSGVIPAVVSAMWSQLPVLGGAPIVATALPAPEMPSASAEERHGRRGAVEVVAAAHRPDLPGAEHAGQGRVRERLADRVRVVVRHPEQPPAPLVAGEDQGTVGPPVRHERREVLVRGAGVAHVELHGGADLDLVADRDGTRLLVAAEHRAHQ